MQCYYQSCELDPDFWGTSTGWCPGSSNAKLFLPPWAWWICMAKQKYSTAAGFHIWLFPFTLCPKARRNRKVSGPNSIIPQATSWTAKSYCRFMLFFSPCCLLRGAASFSLPLPSFPQPLLIHSALWKQMEKGVKMTGVCPPCTGCVPPLVVSPTPQVAHSQVACTFLFTASEALSFKAARSSPSPPSWSTRRHEEVFSLWNLSTDQSPSTCELHCWSKDEWVQAYAPFHRWLWAPLMGTHLPERVTWIPGAACHKESRNKKKKWSASLSPCTTPKYVWVTHGVFLHTSQYRAPELELSSH